MIRQKNYFLALVIGSCSLFSSGILAAGSGIPAAFQKTPGDITTGEWIIDCEKKAEGVYANLLDTRLKNFTALTPEQAQKIRQRYSSYKMNIPVTLDGTLNDISVSHQPAISAIIEAARASGTETKDRLTKHSNDWHQRDNKKDDAFIEYQKNMATWDGLSNLVSNPKNIALIAGGAILTYASWKATQVIWDHIAYSLKTPPFIEDTNDIGLWDQFLALMTGTTKRVLSSQLPSLFFDEETRTETDKIIRRVKRAVTKNMPLRHYVFYGPGGTGKTQMARRIALESKFKYILLSGGKFASLVKDNGHIAALNKLMTHIKGSPHKFVIFIDEAEKLLDSNMQSEDVLQFIAEFKRVTGDANNNKFMFILATNHPEDIDPIVRQRMHSVPFKLPDAEIRKKILEHDIQRYLTKPRELGRRPCDTCALTTEEITKIAAATEGFSGREITFLIEELRNDAEDAGALVITQGMIDDELRRALHEHRRQAEQQKVHDAHKKNR